MKATAGGGSDDRKGHVSIDRSIEAGQSEKRPKAKATRRSISRLCRFACCSEPVELAACVRDAFLARPLSMFASHAPAGSLFHKLAWIRTVVDDRSTRASASFDCSCVTCSSLRALFLSLFLFSLTALQAVGARSSSSSLAADCVPAFRPCYAQLSSVLLLTSRRSLGALHSPESFISGVFSLRRRFVQLRLCPPPPLDRPTQLAPFLLRAVYGVSKRIAAACTSQRSLQR